MPSFFAGAFALAGLAAALGPILIHLLNRRRFRVVEWAAIDFLREALQRNRRVLQLRDLILLALRVLCLVLFGLAMARPYFSHTTTAATTDQPLHAVLVVDNSLSMGFRREGGTLLDEAKAKAEKFIDRLPDGSRVSVLPLAGSAHGFSRDAYRTKEDAVEALKTIEVVDRSVRASQAFDIAKMACDRVRELSTKRVIFLGDQQAVNWPRVDVSRQLSRLPEVQIAKIDGGEQENAWVAAVELVDGIADVETPASFEARVRYEGTRPRKNVAVTFTVDGVIIATQTVDLEPGQERELTFVHSFDVAAESGKPAFSSVRVSLPPDRLPQDDSRYIVVPVVASLPVVFVDELGEDEDPAKNQYGETFALRRLLSPVSTRGETGRQLVKVVHTRLENLDDPEHRLLRDARLVVVAGIERPGDVTALREYVDQGGQLIIAAGGLFDPGHWTKDAWSDGAGVLPTPIKTASVGQLPDESADVLEPFFISFESLASDYFLIENESRQLLEDLYREPLFFRCVEADLGSTHIDALVAAETKRIEETRRRVEQLEARRREYEEKKSRGEAGETERRQIELDRRELEKLLPGWLRWAERTDAGSDVEGDDNSVSEASEPAGGSAGTADAVRREHSAEELAGRSRPRVLASFTNEVPFVISRDIGRGRVVFVSTSLSGEWNTLPRTNAVLVYDRICRSMLQSTLPRRNLSTNEQILLPIDPTQRGSQFTLTLPGGEEEPISVEALGADVYGVTLRGVQQRGHYRISAYRPGGGGAESKLWEMPFAVNGPESESQLAAFDQATLADRIGAEGYAWIAPEDDLRLEGAFVSGESLWKWLLFSVLLLLLVELAILAWPHMDRTQTERGQTT